MLPHVLGGLKAGDSGNQRTKRGRELARGLNWVAEIGQGRLGSVAAVTRLPQISCPREVRGEKLLEAILSPGAQ